MALSPREFDHLLGNIDSRELGWIRPLTAQPVEENPVGTTKIQNLGIEDHRPGQAYIGDRLRIFAKDGGPVFRRKPKKMTDRAGAFLFQIFVVVIRGQLALLRIGVDALDIASGAD